MSNFICIYIVLSHLLQETPPQTESQTQSSWHPRADLSRLAPRLCHLVRSEHGYGFNLHSDRSRPGQYIRSLDPGSPADRAGLRPQDRLVEVGRQYSAQRGNGMLVNTDFNTERKARSCCICASPRAYTPSLDLPRERLRHDTPTQRTAHKCSEKKLQAAGIQDKTLR